MSLVTLQALNLAGYGQVIPVRIIVESFRTLGNFLERLMARDTCFLSYCAGLPIAVAPGTGYVVLLYMAVGCRSLISLGS
jgi:hypothetical protein